MKARVGLGPVWLWRQLYRWRIVRPPMPQWRVVVEAHPDRSQRAWPPDIDGAICTVLVWAPTVEEAEALAQLAIQAEGLTPSTADAVKFPPSTAPARDAKAMRRTGFAFYGPLPDSPQDYPAGARR